MRSLLPTSVCFLMSLAAAAQGGIFQTVTIDGDFSDWASIPVVDSDPADNPGAVDIGDVKIANDDDFLYIYYTSFAGLTLPTYVSIDFDSNTSTGFDVFGLGLIGADASWQNDFPFTQAAGIFNDGFGMSGDFFGSGAALISPFGDAPEHELAISLDIVFNNGGGPVFDDADFDLLLWTDNGAGDVTSAISYTLAVIPEPSSITYGLLCLLGLVGKARSRCL